MSSKLIFALTSLAGFSVALPASSAPVARSPEWQECTVGTWFSSCPSGIKGCFNYDPCNVQVKERSPEWQECAVGTWYSSCSSGIKGCFNYDPCNVEVKGDWQECAAGTWYSVCPNGYKGCFAYDPCSFPPLETPEPQIGERTDPLQYNLYFLQGNHSTDRVHHLDVRTATARSLVIFDQVPAEAKTCTLKWRQSEDQTTRTLTVKGPSGLVYTRQLSGAPAADQPINTETIAPFVFEDYSASMDFANWRQVAGANSHTGPSLDCSIYPLVVELSADFDKESEVFIANDERNGLYLEFTY